jgi:hypothetical protein
MECETCKLKPYFPGCNRECEHNPACVTARVEKEEKAAARIAANNEAYDRQLSRAVCVGVKAPRRDREDSVFAGYVAGPKVIPVDYPVDEYGNVLDGNEEE